MTHGDDQNAGRAGSLDDAAFESIYREHARYVWGVVRRHGGRERDMEDLVHEVFVAFYRGRDRYDSERPIRPWLHGIAFRVLSDYRRRAGHSREIPVEDAETVRSVPPDAIASLEAKERRSLVAQALERLPDDQRVVFVMHELNEHSIPEIAAGLGIPDNTCYSRLRLARRRFTDAVRRLAHKNQAA